jgi:pyruvate kinase
LKDIGAQHLKVVAKIETKDAIDNIEDIIQHVDGISINRTKLAIIVGESKVTATKKEIISLCNKYGRPVMMHTGINIKGRQQKADIDIIKEEMAMGVDAFVMTKETAIAPEPIDLVTMLYEITNDEKNKAETNFSLDDISMNNEKAITDYIIYNAYRTSKELDIKAIICPTESGYTPARLSSLKPEVPIISFTKNDEAYRYINLLRGVKGYKISSTFDYTNIKQIGKEIIRILFKGNISLDDKVLIVHSSLEQNAPNMINGIELYKFKDI